MQKLWERCSKADELIHKLIFSKTFRQPCGTFFILFWRGGYPHQKELLCRVNPAILKTVEANVPMSHHAVFSHLFQYSWILLPKDCFFLLQFDHLLPCFQKQPGFHELRAFVGISLLGVIGKMEWKQKVPMIYGKFFFLFLKSLFLLLAQAWTSLYLCSPSAVNFRRVWVYRFSQSFLQKKITNRNPQKTWAGDLKSHIHQTLKEFITLLSIPGVLMGILSSSSKEMSFVDSLYVEDFCM